MNQTKTEKERDKEKLAVLQIKRDAYLLKFKLRSSIFRRVLMHLLKTIGEEPTIYFLMQEVRELRNKKN